MAIPGATIQAGAGGDNNHLVCCQLQDFACQMAVGEPKFIQNRKVIRLCDRYQIAGEMRLRPVSMVVPASRDHRWQLACTIRDGKRLVDAWSAHGRQGFDFDFRQFDFVIDLGESRSGASSNTPEIDNPAATLG